MSYDEQYAKSDALFGRDAEETLGPYFDRLEVGGTVLDVGAGQGRNSFYMTDRGFVVHALELSHVAADALEAAAEERGVALEVFRESFATFRPPVESYEGIMVFGLVPDLDWGGIRELVDRVDRWSASGALIWISGFTTEDPGYSRFASEWEEVGLHSFRGPGGRQRTFLEPGQILQLMSHHILVHHAEGLGPEHRHGDGPPERHGLFHAVFQKESEGS